MSSLWPDALRLPHLSDGAGLGGGPHARMTTAGLGAGGGGASGGGDGRSGAGVGSGSLTSSLSALGLGSSVGSGGDPTLGGVAGDDPLLVPDEDAVFKDKLRKFEAADEAFQLLVMRLNVRLGGWGASRMVRGALDGIEGSQLMGVSVVEVGWWGRLLGMRGQLRCCLRVAKGRRSGCRMHPLHSDLLDGARDGWERVARASMARCGSWFLSCV